MKRWKLLIGLLVFCFVGIAATLPTYHVVNLDLEEQSVAVDSVAGDSTLFTYQYQFRVGGMNQLQYRIETTEDDDSLPGQGLSDSVRILLELLRYGVWVVWDSLENDTITDTLAGKILAADGDTAMQEWARITIYIFDTTSDTTATMEFGVDADMFAVKR